MLVACRVSLDPPGDAPQNVDETAASPWVDGVIQPGERDVIQSYGVGNALLAGGARDVFEGWTRPTLRPRLVAACHHRAVCISAA